MYKHMHIYTYMYIHTYGIHTYIHSFIHSCMHSFIHTYTHTYIHTHTLVYIHMYSSRCVYLKASHHKQDMRILYIIVFQIHISVYSCIHRNVYVKAFQIIYQRTGE